MNWGRGEGANRERSLINIFSQKIEFLCFFILASGASHRSVLFVSDRLKLAAHESYLLTKNSLVTISVSTVNKMHGLETWRKHNTAHLCWGLCKSMGPISSRACVLYLLRINQR